MSVDTTPEMLAEQAKAAYANGNYQEAASLFAAAADAFQAAGKPLDAAEMQNNRSVALVQVEAYAEALEAVQGTPEIFAEAGDVRRQGLALGNLGSALEGLKRWEDAAEAYQQAATLLEGAGDREARAAVLQALANIQLRHRDPVEALIAMQEAVDEQPRSLKRSLLKRLLKAPFRLLGGR